MANVNMEHYYVNNSNDDVKDKMWFYKETISEAGNGDWIMIPSGANLITVILKAVGAVAKIQVTNDVEELRKTNGSPVTVDWDLGDINNDTGQSVVLPVAAIRQVNTSGTSILTVKAQ